MSKLFLGFWNVSVILTYIEAVLAVFGVGFAADGQTDRAMLCLMLCGVCDMFDGKIARATKRSEDACVFGIQIDSLCDLVSFGVLPGCIGLSVGIKKLARVCPAFYALCAVIRLAYFNVTEQKRQQESSENRKEFEGLPVTSAALIFPLIYFIGKKAALNMALLMSITLSVVALFFISRIKVKKPQI